MQSSFIDRFNKPRLALVIGVAAAGLAASAKTAGAAIVTQSVTVPTASIFSSAPSGAEESRDDKVTFGQFNPALGTLTGVQFALSIDYSDTATGGPGGGNWSISDDFKVNSGPSLQQGGVPYVQTYNLSVIAPGTTTGIDTDTINVDGPFDQFAGVGTFVLHNYSPSIDFSGGGQAPVFSSLSIISPSSITETFTYTPTAVPEPTTVAVLGVSTAVALLRRRRTLA